MCGIVGVVSNSQNGFTVKEMDIFTNLLFLDTMRGFDSTGIFGVTNKGNVSIHKEASHGLAFLASKEYKAFKPEMIASGKFVVGHNRAATRGNITDQNAHPFWVDDKIVLVQNGTYKGDHSHLKNTEVDTEAVAHVISETAGVAEALQKINASYALVWYNADTKELNLIRNAERPLFIAEFYGSGLVFASEAPMIEYAARRADIPLKAPPVAIPEHTHVVLTLDGKGGYTRSDTKIDAAYRFPKGTAVDYTEEDWYSRYRPQQQHQYNLTAGRSNRVGNGKDDVTGTFAEKIILQHKQYLFSSMEEATADIDAVRAAATDGFHYIEVVDYLPANERKDCTAWHVYGTVIANEIEPTKPTTLIHWLVYGEEEQGVLDKYFSSFFKVKLSTTISRRVRLADTTDCVLNTAYASETTELHGVTA